MPNIEFYFPSTDLSALRKLPAVERGGAIQLSLAGLYKLPSPLPATRVPPANFWRYPSMVIFFFKLASMIIFRVVIGLKQNCLKGIETSERGRVLSHAEASFNAVSVLQRHSSFVTSVD